MELLIRSLNTRLPYRFRYLRERQHIPCRSNERRNTWYRYQRGLGRICLAAEQPQQSTRTGYLQPRDF